MSASDAITLTRRFARGLAAPHTPSDFQIIVCAERAGVIRHTSAVDLKELPSFELIKLAKWIGSEYWRAYWRGECA